MHKMAWGWQIFTLDDGMWQTNYCCPRPSPQPRQRQVPIRRTRCSWSGSSCMRRCGGTSWRCGRQRPSWARRCNLRAPKLSRCAVFRVVFLAHRGRVADPPLLRFFLNNNKALNQQLAFVFFCFICFHRNSILFLGYLILLTSQFFSSHWIWTNSLTLEDAHVSLRLVVFKCV